MSNTQEVRKLHEQLEELTGKKVVYTLREGTWALPDTPDKIQKCQGAIATIEQLRDSLYHVCGDDTLYDHFEGAVARMKEMTAEGEEGYKTMLAAAEDRMAKDKGDQEVLQDEEEVDAEAKDDQEDAAE